MTNRAMNSSGIVNVADLRRMAQRRVPKSVFDYLDGGAESEITLSENCRAFRDVTFRPRGAIAISDCDLSNASSEEFGQTRVPSCCESNARGINCRGKPGIAAHTQGPSDISNAGKCKLGIARMANPVPPM